jgi:hypothetical protein
MIFLLYASPLLKLLVFKTIKVCKKENNIPLGDWVGTMWQGFIRLG